MIFNYFGKEIPVNITVTARKATKLSVLAAPAKTQFTVGNTIFLQLIRFKYRSLRPIIICDLQFHTGQIQRVPNCKLSFYNGCSR